MIPTCILFEPPSLSPPSTLQKLSALNFFWLDLFCFLVIFYICDKAGSQSDFILRAFQHGLSNGDYVFYFIDTAEDWVLTETDITRFGIKIGFHATSLILTHENNEANFKGMPLFCMFWLTLFPINLLFNFKNNLKRIS